jgi:L-rhamnose isomerase
VVSEIHRFNFSSQLFHTISHPGNDRGEVDEDYGKRIMRLIDYCINSFGEVSLQTLSVMVYYYVGSVGIERAVTDAPECDKMLSRVMHVGAELDCRESKLLCLKAKSFVLFNAVFSSGFKHGAALREIVDVWKSLVIVAGRYHPTTIECAAIMACLQWFRGPDFYVSAVE